MSFEEIKRDISNRKYHSVYLLMGDESYYIDEITDSLLESVIPEEEKDFNQIVRYGSEIDVPSLVSMARSYPMISDRQIIVVKEAQNLRKIEDLETYTKNPITSTILVLNYKNGFLDKRKKLYSSIEKNGVIFESKKLQDYKIPAFITSYIKSKGLSIDQKSAQILTDYLGNDLCKVVNEINKLSLSLSASEKRITAETIEQNIGISKEFNNYELLKAIVEKDIFKANQIADFFKNSPKNNPIIVTLSVIFNFFSSLMVCYWIKVKNENSIASELGLRNVYQAKDYLTGLKNYNAFKSMEIISLLRSYDAKSKGVGNLSTSDGELLKELLFKIMH